MQGLNSSYLSHLCHEAKVPDVTVATASKGHLLTEDGVAAAIPLLLSGQPQLFCSSNDARKAHLWLCLGKSLPLGTCSMCSVLSQALGSTSEQVWVLSPTREGIGMQGIMSNSAARTALPCACP